MLIINTIKNILYNSLENLCNNPGHCSDGYNCKRFWKQNIGLCVPGKGEATIWIILLTLIV